MKKIAIVSNTGWSLYNFRQNLMKALMSEGYEVVALSPVDEYTERLPVRHIPLDISRKGINPLGELKLMSSLKSIYKEEHVDYVLHFTTKPNVWGTLAAHSVKKTGKIGIVNNIAGLGIVFAKKGPVRFILENLYRFSQSKADRIFFQNPDDHGLFTKAHLVPPSRADILPGSGVDLEKFPYIPLEEKDSQSLSFIMSARLLKEKGVVEYVQAAAEIKKRYPRVKFTLLGKVDRGNKTSVTEGELKEWVEEGIVEWIPWSDKVSEEIRKADCVVLPSYYREGTPRSLLEGMALGRPIITTDSPGCRETVEEGVNGFMVEPRSVESLVSAFDSYLSLEPKERHSMSLAARRRAEEKYDEKIVIRRYINTLNLIEEE
ncbi:MAG: glycosyltransferase family 4 protein [Spirochaetales bacterium]|nr:glycosyltransferase family 4 protein [Spirochaetales bacterium]